MSHTFLHASDIPKRHKKCLSNGYHFEWNKACLMYNTVEDSCVHFFKGLVYFQLFNACGNRPAGPDCKLVLGQLKKNLYTVTDLQFTINFIICEQHTVI